MSVSWNALRSPEIGISAKVVYCALVEFALSAPVRHPDEMKLRFGEVAITMKALAELLCMNARTVSASVKELERARFIVTSRRDRFWNAAVQETVFAIPALQEEAALAP